MASPMKAYTYSTSGYPSNLSLSTTTTTPPSTPSPNHILVRIAFCALNPVDIQLMNLPLWSLPLASLHSLSQPKTPCSDFSGTVLAAGPSTPFRAGDEVFGVNMKPVVACGGTLAATAHLDLATTTVATKPAAWTHERAAGVGCVWLTARTCVEAVAPWVAPTETKRLAVLGGSSASGMLTVRLAKRRGWKVLASCSARNAEFVGGEGVGADEVVDYTSASVADAVRAFKPDAIVDCVGGTECLGIAPRYVTIVGDKTSRSTMGGSFLYLVRPWMVLRWAWGRYGWGERYDCIILEQRKEWLEEAVEELDDWRGMLVDSVFEFEDAKEAFQRLDTGRARGKVVVRIAGE